MCYRVRRCVIAWIEWGASLQWYFHEVCWEWISFALHSDFWATATVRFLYNYHVSLQVYRDILYSAWNSISFSHSVPNLYLAHHLPNICGWLFAGVSEIVGRPTSYHISWSFLWPHIPGDRVSSVTDVTEHGHDLHCPFWGLVLQKEYTPLNLNKGSISRNITSLDLQLMIPTLKLFGVCLWVSVTRHSWLIASLQYVIEARCTRANLSTVNRLSSC